VRGLVLGQPEPVHGVVPAQLPPQPGVVSVDTSSGSNSRVGSSVHFGIGVSQSVHFRTMHSLPRAGQLNSIQFNGNLASLDHKPS
jgi:hypothetical protein